MLKGQALWHILRNETGRLHKMERNKMKLIQIEEPRSSQPLLQETRQGIHR